jgi:hypothetical protein
MFKKIILTICLIIFAYNNTYAIDLSDINNHWAYKDIKRFTNNEYIKGYPDGTFKPDNTITVNEFLKLFICAANLKLAQDNKGWAGKYIKTAENTGLIKSGEFIDFERPITRFEVAKIISRYIDTSNIKNIDKSFTDLSEDSKETVSKLSELGIIKGYDDNTFRGSNSLTRGEAVTILCRVINVKRDQIRSKIYNLNNADSLTNIGDNADVFANRYEYINGKISFIDNGRYAILNNYIPNETYIKNKILANIIKTLISEDSYVYVAYVPDEMIVNQIIITYGERAEYIKNGIYNFSYTFYENKPWNLKEVTQDDQYSENCFMELTVCKMWKEPDELENGIYASEDNLIKMEKSLSEIIGNNNAKSLREYINKKITDTFETYKNKEAREVVTIGKYKINFYKTNNYILRIYIGY